MGILLLKGIAAVAEVARQEDFGLDAVATLLRLDEDKSLYAEDSFYVQLKSSTEKLLSYSDHEIDWVVNHSLPTFIGLVSLEEGKISLYSTIYINQAVFSLCPERVDVTFGKSSIPGFFSGMEFQPWGSNGDGNTTVWLGAPVLEWTVKDIRNREWAKRTYGTLKKFLRTVQRELHLLSLQQSSVLNWSTNDTDSIEALPGLMKGHPDQLREIAERSLPLIQAMMMRVMWRKDESSRVIAKSLVDLVTALQADGIDVDSDRRLGLLFSWMHANNDASGD
ncbi:hypothetical protein [Stieleria mannarensis]|uniref:hypothetical protein n=1 Tax=Stieleria mannarensis TaxID=2755585 RepID=UPI0016024E40|nr:hypothetical protein [Rhodopirellula sp. JC639]